MSSAVDSSVLPPTRSTGAGWLGVPTASWVRAAILTLAFVALYKGNLVRLWEKTNFINGDPNWSHAVCVPLVGLYYLMLRRDELAHTPAQPLLAGNFSRQRFVTTGVTILIGLVAAYAVPPLIPKSEGLWLVSGIIQNVGIGITGLGCLALVLDWGLATLVGGLLLSAYGIWPGYNDFIWDSGMIITLFGVVLTMCGWAVMRVAWFPILFLFCALPWPGLVYSQIASPLQGLAARVSVSLLNIVGVNASFGGTKIFIPKFSEAGIRLADRASNVAEACAGLRSLMTFITLATAVAFLSARPLWQKLIIAASAVPIAISCNVMRVAGQGLLDTYVGQEWSEGFAHQFAGMVMLLPAFFLVMLVVWVVDHLFIEEAEAAEMKPAEVKASSAIPQPILPVQADIRRRWAFIIVAAILVAAALGLNIFVQSMKVSFRKEAVDPAEPLKLIHADLGPWAQVTVDRAMNPDFEHELGTGLYLFRDYVDTRKLSEADRKKLLAASMEDREKLRVTMPALVDPKNAIRFALTYYTGSVDTVPHVPDRCYAADGFKPSAYQVVTWPVLPREKESDRNVGVRLINFEDQIDSRRSRPRQVAYFFQVNGFYENDPIFGVRKRLQNLFERRAYFAKIELVTDQADNAAAEIVMADFLKNAMPDVERVLPQWTRPTN
ncbi:MAG: exosortase/archaeosortase family protein [Tepidisphaeraceae bacterium]